MSHPLVATETDASLTIPVAELNDYGLSLWTIAFVSLSAFASP
jgi:hypothetical protein